MPYKNTASPEAVESLKKAKRRHYEANAERYKQQARERTDRLKRLSQEARNVPCVDCGVRYPWYVMDFDHLPTETKVAGVQQLIHAGVAEWKILAEMAKCEIVCANCHRVRTMQRILETTGVSSPEDTAL